MRSLHSGIILTKASPSFAGFFSFSYPPLQLLEEYNCYAGIHDSLLQNPSLFPFRRGGQCRSRRHQPLPGRGLPPTPRRI
ncbi:hypothetical protein VN97_g11308 [Penicillium thymicola]|uniref:Uncharacterized protein n=1 Tax=Penicillium thymicola TaxID=293382 RepID=A0AAI9T8F1_PENTH|nr:hypothetical protein VN97_g11308 [Penicillium thymicola]